MQAGAAAARPQACVFDAYGTLFDVAAPANACKAALGEAAEALTALWRRKQLEYTWLRSLMGRHADFRQVTADALDHALAALRIDRPGLRDRLLDAYMTLDAHPEVPAALEALRRDGMRLAVLSNGTPAMLDAACRRNGLAPQFEAVLSVEAVGIYKPHPGVYRHAAEQLALQPERILFLSANGWDIAGAASFGFRAVWVNRTGQPRDNLPGAPVAEIADLSFLPALARAATAGEPAR
jgi:2-haloacid dehalogenase